MSRFWKIALIVLAVVIVAVVAVRVLHKPAGAGAKGADGKDNAPPVPVTVVPVAKQNVPVYLTALGTVQALNTVTVLPQVSGRLLSIDFTEGQPVTKGQVLARIDREQPLARGVVDGAEPPCQAMDRRRPDLQAVVQRGQHALLLPSLERPRGIGLLARQRAPQPQGGQHHDGAQAGRDEERPVVALPGSAGT